MYYGGGSGLGGQDYAVHAGIAQGARRDRPDGDHGDTILQNAELLLAGELEETLHGAGAEEKNSVRLPARDAGELFLIGIGWTHGAIGDDLGNLDAELLQGGRQIRIRAIAAWKQHALATQTISQFFGKSDTEVGAGHVMHSESRFFRFVLRRRSNDGDARGGRIFAEGTTLADRSPDHRLDGVGAGEHDPVEAIPLQ